MDERTYLSTHLTIVDLIIGF